ncbi:RNA polymerase sigma factor SigJ [Streptomyces sp. BI20]|uniref:RNA polymerase sigma factor SigJ n=1 Tax=Streptomyces sp. BI20 TaxID=3403460 RepID=UPI003C745189
MDAGVEAGERRRLLGLAWRLLGSAAEAEDAVQEAYVRWYALTPARRAAVEVPAAWFTTVVGRICLDVLGSARVRRERYVGEWLPEPVPGPLAGAGPVDPAERVAADESLSTAFLLVLDAMTPRERVVFVLHDVFRYPFAEIARIVGASPGACRQAATSARRRVRADAPPAPTADRAGVVRRFRRAWEAGDVTALLALLDPDAVLTVDGGGLVRAALRPIRGGATVADYLCAFATAAARPTLLERTVNGGPGLIARLGPTTVTVAALDVTAGRVTHIWAVRNPEKLAAWQE